MDVALQHEYCCAPMRWLAKYVLVSHSSFTATRIALAYSDLNTN